MSNQNKIEIGLCRDCVHWKIDRYSSLEDYPRDNPPNKGWVDGICQTLEFGITINASGGWEGATVDSVETDANFGCVYFKAKE